MELNADTRKFTETIIKYLTTTDASNYEFMMENDNPHLENIQVMITIKRHFAPVDGLTTGHLSVYFRSCSIFSHGSSYDYKIYPLSSKMTNFDWVSTHPEYLENAIKVVSDNLENIILDKKYGQLILTTDRTAMMEYEIKKMTPTLFKHLKKVQKRKEENVCSVCLEETVTKTPCEHHLCVECWEKLEQKCCPLCRGDIEYEDREEDYE